MEKTSVSSACIEKMFTLYLVSLKGGMAEWFKAAVLKTAVSQGTVGSNPTPSANNQANMRRGDRGAEGARLLSECMLKSVPWVRIPPSLPLFIILLVIRINLLLPVKKTGFFLTYFCLL